ncbi:dynein regulatory complex protein 11 [Serinus canaria]|uniref:dynein regulatory complex protein 11 n=1 Tax=Serinus canaria TaxID=9135 RepID=UPI0021CC6E03|nr:dynein regulatory complex protein 11 [Serinus canaria]
MASPELDHQGKERSRGSHLGAQRAPTGERGRPKLPQTLPPRETRAGTRRRGSPHPVRARRDAGEAASAQEKRARVPQPLRAPPVPPLPQGLAAALPERVSAAPPPTPPYIGREGSPPPGGGSGGLAPIGTAPKAIGPAPARPHSPTARPEIRSAQPRLGPVRPRLRPRPGSEGTYSQIWADTQRELDTMLQREREEFLQPQEDPENVMKMLATAYVQYLAIMRKLDEAHDHLIHQQKRALVRQALDGVMGRILEIKREMVALEYSECHSMAGILMELQRVPEDIEIPIPKYFIKENLGILQYREKYLHEVLLNAGLLEQEAVTVMTLQESIRVIQVAERARQGRARAAFMRRIYFEEKRQSQKGDQKMVKSPDDAATCIQKVWRGHRQRKETERLREEEMIFLGMSLPPELEAMNSLQKANVLEGEVRERPNFSFRHELRAAEGPHIKETLQNEITQCFLECRHITGRFPDYPPEKAGGSKAILSEKHPEQIVQELAAKKAKAEAEKNEADKKVKEVKEPVQEKKPEKAGKEVVDEGWKMAPSNFLLMLEEGSSQYQVFWENRDHKSDFLQDHDPELIRAGERGEVEEEIRVQVDEVMEEKLLRVKEALDGETGPPAKPGKEKGIRTPAKKKISELDKDLTPHRSIDSLYQELAEERLLIQVKNVNLSDYMGYYDCLMSILREAGAMPVPSIPEVRQLVALYGILPLGSQTVHENAPLVKSLLLAGPAGVGKKMLVHAICTETGANLFSLTPSSTRKYPGKEGLIMMLHMILKVGRELQPSVVWIGDTERLYAKGALKGEEEVNFKRLARLLPQFLRVLKPKDRILLLGTSRRPFDANLGPFCKLYQKIILIPKPDYLTRFALWKHYILQSGGVLTKLLNLNCLAQVSDGFTQGHFVDVVHTVLTELRLLQMARKPLSTAEFVTSLARHDPVYREEEETFQAWYAKTPLGKAWNAARETDEGGKGKRRKGKKRKGKGKGKK